MAEHVAKGALAYPRDLGTDAPEDYERQDSAGFLGGLARHKTFLDYVETGLDFDPNDGTNTLTIGTGLAHLLIDEKITVQNQSGDFSLDWRNGMGVAVDMPERTGIDLMSNAENHVYLNYRPQLDEPGHYVVNSTDTVPSDGYHLKLGVVDTTGEDATVEYADAHHGMNGTWGLLYAKKTVDDPDSVTRREWVVDRLSSLRSDLESQINSVASDLSDHIGSNTAHGSDGAVAGQNDVDSVESDLTDHTESDTAHGSNGQVAGQEDLYTDDEARSAVDGSNVSVAHATNADNAISANQADNATSADFADQADQATNADHASTADSATQADNATNADHASTADSATQADSADAVDGYDIQKNGTDGQGVINFKTE